ncbi:calcium homeostasis endoplasmic reticulum protein-like [Acanthaster planci]|uniref:Calcium homeostasis endoplasmic reticulum protein-like n=1 Tax=Acanthaster planci TaxID=133434 RepID=A0A8B7Y3J8_ACAPL|nr:calcium homeostasis endoplasmic reticulum protein-like [Acanthaster planci]
MDNQPIAPDDPELKNIIDKLANFVARNGPEFEKMTKHKQMNNPKFNFLYGGEHFNYYQCKVATEQQIMRQRKEKLAQQQAIIQDVITQQSIQSAPWQQQQQHPLPMPPQMPTPQMQQPPPQMAPPPWQQPQPQPHPQPQPPPPMPHPAQPLAPPHHPALQQQQQQQQQQLQFQQQHMQQQLQAEKEKQDQLLKEQQEKEQLEQEQQQILGEREQLQAQIKESEENLQKQHEVFLLQQQEQIELGIVSAQNQEIQNLAKELEVDIGDFDTRLQTIIDSCTKDAISNGKLWIFSWAKSDKHCLLIAHYLLHKIIPLGTPFEAKLHLIYLINDVTHHCMRRGAGNLQQALGQVVGPIFCSTYLSADEEKKKKLEKVLKLWETNKYFGDDVMIALKNPESSMSAFKAGQLEQFSEVVSHVREGIAEQLSRLQKQHDEFVDHVNSMIQGLDARLDKLTGNDQSTVEARQEADDQGPDGNDVNTSMPGNNLPPASMSMMGAGGMPGIIPGAPGSVSSGPGMPPVPIDPAAMATMFPNFDPSVPPPGFGSIPRVPFQPGLPPPNFPPPQPGMPPPMPMLHPPNHPRGPIPPMPDFSKPPPGFNEFPQDFPPDFNPNVLPPDMEIMPLDPNDPSLMPEVPYFDLPAGLMAPLVKLEDTEYEPLDPEDIRLPPPQPPSKRLLAAVEAFYAPPSREAPRNSEGWEQNGLFEFFKAKQKYSKLKKERLEHEGVQRKVHIPSPIRRDSSSSRSPSPRLEEDAQRSRRRYRSKSRSRSRSKSPVRRRRSVSPSRSRSRSPPYRRRSNSRSPPPRRRNRSRSRSRSRTPPRRRRERSRSPSPDFGIQPFYQTNTNTRLGEENKGALLMKKMGWGGQGLGAREQGIVDPVSGGEVRDKIDMYRGVGMEINDPFESFRKNKSSSFMTRMKARAAKSGK